MQETHSNLQIQARHKGHKGASRDIQKGQNHNPRTWRKSVPDLDLEIRGAPVIQTLRKGAAQSPKEFFSARRASVWSKNKGGKGGGFPGPLPWIRHWISLQWCMTCVCVFSLFFRHGNETRLNQIDDKPFTSHPPHETDHTTGVYALVFSKRCGLFYVLSESYLHKCWALEKRQINGFRLYPRRVLCRRKN